MQILTVAGARPNFVKIAPLLRAIESAGDGRIESILVDTGQHYDDSMAASVGEASRQRTLPAVEDSACAHSSAATTARCAYRGTAARCNSIAAGRSGWITGAR